MTKDCHILVFMRQPDERIVVGCSCGWFSAPVWRVAPVSGGPTAASVAYLHMQASRLV